MANVNDVFDDVTGKQSFFIPGAKKKQEIIPFAKGEYLAHIIESDSKVVDVNKGEFRAELFTYVVEAAEENKDKDFSYTDITGNPCDTKGDVYIGRKFRGKLWRFLEPTKKDTFKSNSSGNSGYMRFCEIIGVECPTEKKEIGDDVVEVKLLPTLTAKDMLGKAVTAVVDKGRPWKDKTGRTRQYWDCKFCKVWEDGKEKEVGDTDVPF